LKQAEEGSYGICERCGEPIDPARLEIVPEALCASSARRLSSASPAQERRLLSSISSITQGRPDLTIPWFSGSALNLKCLIGRIGKSSYFFTLSSTRDAVGLLRPCYFGAEWHTKRTMQPREKPLGITLRLLPGQVAIRLGEYDRIRHNKGGHV